MNKSRIRPFQNSLLNWSCTVMLKLNEKGGRGLGVVFYISPTGSAERKALLDALKDLVWTKPSDQDECLGLGAY